MSPVRALETMGDEGRSRYIFHEDHQKAGNTRTRDIMQWRSTNLVKPRKWITAITKIKQNRTMAWHSGTNLEFKDCQDYTERPWLKRKKV